MEDYDEQLIFEDAEVVEDEDEAALIADPDGTTGVTGDATDDVEPDALDAANEDGFVAEEAAAPSAAGARLPPGYGTVVRWSGAGDIPGLPTRNELIEADPKMAALSARIGAEIERRAPVMFMPNDVEDSVDYGGAGAAWGQRAAHYCCRIYGVLVDGTKAEVVLTGIDPCFEVLMPGSTGADDAAELEAARMFDTRLRAILGGAGAHSAVLSWQRARPIRGFNPGNALRWIRCSFAELKHRKDAINAVRAAGLTTAGDDRSSYYRKLAREHALPLSDWAMLGAYEVASGLDERNPQCVHRFRVPYQNYVALVDPLASKEERAPREAARAKNPLLTRDRTLVGTWDIETVSPTGELPDATRDSDQCFMLCGTFHWKDDTVPLYGVTLTTIDAAPDPRWLTVVCDSPATIILAWGTVLRRLAPDALIGFNDGGYDWPFIVEKARRFGILAELWNLMSAAPRRDLKDEAVLRWNYARDKRIKIEADSSMLVSYLRVPGCVPADVRVSYRKLYPKNEVSRQSSLKFYLGLVKLPSKADMPIRRMWRYYDESVAVAAEKAPAPADLARVREQARQIAYYCWTDAIRCQELYLKRNLYADQREVARLAFVSYNDSIYYAGGMKVCNLLGAAAARRGMVISMIPGERVEEGKYPGAYVFPPKKGLYPDPDRFAELDAYIAKLRQAPNYPDNVDLDTDSELAALFELIQATVTGLDFSSLYPSLIMAYNLSPEMIILDEAEARQREAEGYRLHRIEFEYNNRIVRGWSIAHENKPELFGLYPSVLRDLFGMRAEVKVVLNKHASILELIGALKTASAVVGADGAPVGLVTAARQLWAETGAKAAAAEAATAPGAPAPRVSPGATLEEELRTLAEEAKKSRGLLEELRELFGEPLAAAIFDGGERPTADLERDANARVAKEQANSEFEWTCANSKQLALKVYMNTFYGEAGNSLSPFFLLQLAGGVTAAGRYNIQMVAAFVRKLGFVIAYGDTDSLYIVPPHRYFRDVDRQYARGELTREEYLGALVRITMRVMTVVRDEVNGCLAKDNGTKYLKMAYEEVLCPAALTGKKKYFGIGHEGLVNFKPKKLFIRGIDAVKRGVTPLARDIAYRIMWLAVQTDNTKTLLTLTEEVLHDAVTKGAWKLSDFTKSATWRPQKNNVSVHRFIARMTARLALGTTTFPMPEPGERFDYVLVKQSAMFDLRGCKSNPKIGDRMEFPQVASAMGLEVDVSIYLLNYVVGLCARFILGDAKFLPPGSVRPGPHGPEIAPGWTEKGVDEASQKAAKKHLEKFIKAAEGGVDPAQLRQRGYAYRRAYKAAAAETQRAVADRLGPAAAAVLASPVGRALFGDDGAEVADGADGDDAGDADEPERPEQLPGWIPAVFRIAAQRAAATVNPRLVTALARRLQRQAAADSSDAALTAALYRLLGRHEREHFSTAAYDRAEASVRSALVRLGAPIADIAARYEAGLHELVRICREREHARLPSLGEVDKAIAGAADAEGGDAAHRAAAMLAPEDAKVLAAAADLASRAAGIATARALLTGTRDELRRYKNAHDKHIAAPRPAAQRAAIAAAAAGLAPLGLE